MKVVTLEGSPCFSTGKQERRKTKKSGFSVRGRPYRHHRLDHQTAYYRRGTLERSVDDTTSRLLPSCTDSSFVQQQHDSEGGSRKKTNLEKTNGVEEIRMNRNKSGHCGGTSPHIENGNRKNKYLGQEKGVDPRKSFCKPLYSLQLI